ncbi:MAG: fructose-bisphosphate aldolase class I [Actinobacteria bacterium]|nr:MAG: fructose-bisphosphate aldolase class I [Actinomycetota bacterium]
MNIQELSRTAQAMVAEGKGILAADESSGTIAKRFASVGVESTEENRRQYRQLLLTTEGVEQFISGVIMYDETIRQSTDDGTPFPKVLQDKGIIPGIKVDKGAKDMPLFPGEKITEGLDGLRERLIEYRDMGARFAKWRAVIAIGEDIPSITCMQANAEVLARYAALCQEQDIVPIVEPEVLMDGSHDIIECQQVSEVMFASLFAWLRDHGVVPEGLMLKPNMVISGKESAEQADVDEVADRTIETLRHTVPAAVPGVVFLSGGQTPELATEHLNAMNQRGPHPWVLSFSYSRALQEPVLNTWRGDPSKVAEAQRIFYHRAKMNSMARQGRYTKDMETMAA